MKPYRTVILTALFLFYSFGGAAQDSSSSQPDSSQPIDPVQKQERMTDNEGEENELVGNDTAEILIYPVTTDTLLRSNQLSLEPDSVEAIKNSKSFAYAKNLDSLLLAYKKNLEKEDAAANNKMSWIARFFSSPITRYFFWALAIFFVSFILYKIFFAEGFFQRSSATIADAGLPDESDRLSKSTDYTGLIAKAVGNKNYRMAVRYHYLQTLQKLATKGAIQYTPDKTNDQYLKELSGKPYRQAFASLTLNYEYVWYGEFEINEAVFRSIQNKFKQFNQGM